MWKLLKLIAISALMVFIVNSATADICKDPQSDNHYISCKPLKTETNGGAEKPVTGSTTNESSETKSTPNLDDQHKNLHTDYRLRHVFTTGWNQLNGWQRFEKIGVSVALGTAVLIGGGAFVYVCGSYSVWLAASKVVAETAGALAETAGALAEATAAATTEAAAEATAAATTEAAAEAKLAETAAATTEAAAEATLAETAATDTAELGEQVVEGVTESLEQQAEPKAIGKAEQEAVKKRKLLAEAAERRRVDAKALEEAKEESEKLAEQERKITEMNEQIKEESKQRIKKYALATDAAKKGAERQIQREIVRQAGREAATLEEETELAPTAGLTPTGITTACVGVAIGCYVIQQAATAEGATEGIEGSGSLGNAAGAYGGSLFGYYPP